MSRATIILEDTPEGGTSVTLDLGMREDQSPEDKLSVSQVIAMQLVALLRTNDTAQEIG